MADGGDTESTKKVGERKECLSLKCILEGFNAAINEEQAWAVCYQAVRCSTVDVIAPEHASCSVETIFVEKDGSVHVTSGNYLSPPSAERTTTESQFIKSLGIVIYSALDYGVSESEERHLSNTLEDLIECMTAGGDDDSQTGDEGFENDIDGSVITAADVLERCANHLQRREDAPDHYRAVCRALVAEAKELLTFLEKISTSKECLESSDEVDGDLRELGRFDWARLWVQVLQQLRQGVKLKKVEHVDLRPLEFELTPYEILMEDIRMRRYTLNKIMVDGEVPVSLAMKNDAHSVILDFIRSRPPLQPVSERKLKSPPPRTPILHEQLLEAIKGEHKLRKTPTKIVETSRTKLCESDDTPAPTRKIIKPDFSLLLSSFDDDSSDDDFDDIDVGLFSPRFNRSLIDLSPCSDNPLSPISPNGRNGSDTKQVTPDVTWQKAVARDVLLVSQKRIKVPERRHSITVCESPTKSSKKRWQHPIECLSLTIEEVMHIRSVLTKAEVESLLFNPTLYSLVSRGKVCFTCKKTRFALFGPWGTKCKFCRSKVCQRCIKKMRIPTDHFENIPVYTLSPSPLSPDSTQEIYTKEKTGSVPTSPIPDRKNNRKQSESSISSALDFKPGEAVKVKLEGPLMNICKDCKSLVLNVIRASRTTIAMAHEAANSSPTKSSGTPAKVPRNFHLDLKTVY